ncbi:MAG: NAD(P)H-dependent oxidoreductase subunit E [Clostridia bacterium]|nr:NAD(P)H-dependent oxidoreductase subunit E [Clostridia bacterium]
MISVYICVGSSCHLKGSYYIIRAFQEMIKKYQIEDKVELKASFCLGECTKGVCAKVEDRLIENLNPSNVEENFKKYVMERLQK